jgi:hypothetical protein
MGHWPTAGTTQSGSAGFLAGGAGSQPSGSGRRLVVTAMTEIEYRLLQNQIFIMTHLQDLVGRKEDLEAAIRASEKMLTTYHMRSAHAAGEVTAG